MANAFAGMYIGTTGLQGAQAALNTTANNLANVNTKGYVRQQVRFKDRNYDVIDKASMLVSTKQSGLGVSIGDVVHSRDVFLDKAYRLESGREAFYETCYETANYMESLFQELDGEKFKSSIENLWVAFQELAKAPADTVNQNLVLQKAELLVSRTQTFYGDIQSYQLNINDQIKDDIKTINEIGNRIFELNKEIQKAEAGQVETAMTFRDERDYLLDKLASYVNIDVREEATGFVYVQIETVDFIVEKGCNNIGTNVDRGTGFATPYWPQLSDSENELYTPVLDVDKEISSESNTDIGSLIAKLVMRGETNGKFVNIATNEAYSHVEDCMLMETQGKVDMLFHDIITTMNDIFCPNIETKVTSTLTSASGKQIKAGSEILILDKENSPVGVDGKLPPRELFERPGFDRYTEYTDAEGNVYYVYNKEDASDPSSLYTVGNVRVNEEMTKQTSLLPAYTQNGAVDMQLGQNLANAWEKATMHINPNDSYPCTFQGYYDKMIGELGTIGSIYKASTETMTNSVATIDNKRAQLIGVSSDEELTKMVKYQAAFNASSRYINVVSEMIEHILNGLGV